MNCSLLRDCIIQPGDAATPPTTFTVLTATGIGAPIM
jgi:hypothetical protein